MSLLEDIEAGPIPADFPTESLLIKADISMPACQSALNLSHPELISEIHSKAIAAGAKILRTNSLGAHPGLLQPHGLADRVNEINWQASQIAKEAVAGSGVRIAGRVGPLGLSPEELQARGWDPEECFRVQIGALLDGGADTIWLEGFQDLKDLILALEVKHSLHHCPAICSLAIPRPETGLSLSKVFLTLIAQDAEILGLDGAPPAEMMKELQTLDPSPQANLDFPPLAVLLRSDSDSESFASAGLQMAAAGATILGGGSGTGPQHIAALSRALAEKTRED